jgi:hypothetical protein
VVRDIGSAGIWDSSRMAPGFWCSDPFALFLERAACGFLDDVHLDQGGQLSRGVWAGRVDRAQLVRLFAPAELPLRIGKLAAFREMPREGRLDARQPRAKWQSVFYQTMLRTVFPPRLEGLIRQRLHKHFGIRMGPAHGVRNLLQAMPPSWATVAVRTYLGGWTTNRRMQIRAGCVYGCQGCAGAISHYVAMCSRCHHFAALVLRSDVPGEAAFRLGVRGGNLAFLLAMYHHYR